MLLKVHGHSEQVLYLAVLELSFVLGLVGLGEDTVSFVLAVGELTLVHGLQRRAAGKLMSALGRDLVPPKQHTQHKGTIRRGSLADECTRLG